MAKKLPKSPVAPYYRALFHLDAKSLGLLPKPIVDTEAGLATGYVMTRNKWRVDHVPYTIPNEYISACLGTALGLPIPPFALSKTSSHGSVIFSSLDFNPHGIRLAPVEPELCMRNLGSLCVGVVLFDIWIANEDRHDENLAVDKVGNPKTMRVFDHNQALFGGFLTEGVPRFEKLKDRLGITGSTVTGGNKHCLLPYLGQEQETLLDEWTRRVELVPDWCITESCETMRDFMPKKETEAAADFLRHRQQIMRSRLVPDLCELCKIVRSERQKTMFDGMMP